MKQGGDRRAANGFTIVEVLIVLAMTAALFAVAFALISGRQDQTLFMTGINSARQQVQQIINETQSGYYTGSSFQCHGNNSGTPPNVNTSGSTKNCVYLGKAIQFGTDANAGQLVSYAIVGNQRYNDPTNGLQEVQELRKASPIAVYAAATPELHGDSVTLDGGIQVYSATSGAMVVLGSLASYAGCSNLLCSGAQQFNIYKVSGTSVNQNKTDLVSNLDIPNTTRPDGQFFSLDSFSVCFNSGTTNQSGLLTIAGGSLSVSLQIFGQKRCA